MVYRIALQNRDLSRQEEVIRQLEAAGRTLLALPRTGPSTRLVQGGLEWVRDASLSYGRDTAKLSPPVPDAASITHMDVALAWIPLIPIDRYVLRRVVGARALVNPMTDRHLYSWRRLGLALGADHKAVKRWHAQGIDHIVDALKRDPSKQRREPALPKTPGHHRSAHP